MDIAGLVNCVSSLRVLRLFR